MPYGRGGAGNFYKAQEESKKAAEDLEENRTQPTTSTTATSTAAQAAQPYAHTGRGGAGNWYEPATLQQTGTFTQPDDATRLPTGEKPAVSAPWHPEGVELPVARSGRGGAGNFVWKGEAHGEKMNDGEKEREEMVRRGVERDVEAGLQRPGAARVGGKSHWSMLI
ncbi:hypothetical protein P153DRAFT_425617 [Dothidotthia symphoricarpi CBS 119687]|uniref:Uncharacterized protein n=1 Tax=Dothidotthia symphoricarpi CBS 119687 TaxID=1392245 RepID=A0A6A6A1Z6_9PLEO|nr:uncharacterized protein P153DRAFT_425617 [Dothidotthia symphoricarpi CBS 119687]KAF2125830.1 hypothetical protein P153DRAFT_425617 [Dothidotthia symphoricarpi CBS 119687]